VVSIPEISVVVPTHNPDLTRLQRTLEGLRSQTLPPHQWQLVVVDNASDDPAAIRNIGLQWHPNSSLILERQLGLTSARRRGIAESTGQIIVFVDDDNVLAPDYLEQVIKILTAQPTIAAIGGRSFPEFESEPPAWQAEFFPLLALRDLGDAPLISHGLQASAAERNAYPAFAPIGAGMAVRRLALEAWMAKKSHDLSDRRGAELTSSGDNDIILTIMSAGWEVGYFPQLILTHLIPRGRLQPEYLARLNRGIQQSWMKVLTRYQANPWGPLTRSGARLRKLKAWLEYRAWTSPAAKIRWQGACGHFDGRAP
jgi:glycosyltransferase involved in cell wall biosynthesis